MLASLLVISVFYAVPIKAQGTINVGVICDQALTEGLSLWRGVEMAKDEVNTWHDGQGVYFSSTDEYRKVELTYIDEHSSYPFDPAAAVNELVAALPNVDFLIGGFRSECAFPMREAHAEYTAAHNGPIWVVTGCATSRLIDCGGGIYTCGECVRCNYEKYKYIFRNTPQNDSWLVKSFIAFIKYGLLDGLTGAGDGILAKIYGSPVKTYLVVEDLTWTITPRGILAGTDYYDEIMIGEATIPNPYPSPPHPEAILGENAVVVGVTEADQFETDFSTTLTDIENSGARLVIHIFSATAGGAFSKQLGERQVKAVPVGINVESQLQTYWDTTDGKCEYESFLASMGTGTPLIPGVTDKFWDDYFARYTDYPVYTGFASYDALVAAAENWEAAGTLDSEGRPDSDDIIPIMEQSVRDGLLGRFKYTGPNGEYHDVFSVDAGPTWPEPHYVRAQLPQWQAGRMEVVWPIDQPFSKAYALPPWMYPYSDVNYDGNIDIFDVVTIAGAFGHKPGDDEWDIRADLKKNDEIDIFDVVTIANDFGTTVPLPLIDP